LYRITESVGQLRNFQAGIGRVAAAVIKEVTDVVRLEHVDQALVLRRVVFEFFQLEARRAERTRGRVTQRADGGGGFLAGVDQVFCQSADDAVAAGVQLSDTIFVTAAGLDDTGCRRVDDSGDTAGLGVESVAGTAGPAGSLLRHGGTGGVA
jgi:hypothetical protein